MALQGNLTEFSLQEIMTFIADRKKSGVLVIERKEECAQIVFNKGKVIFVEPPFDKDPLIFRLEEQGYVPGGTWRKLHGETLSDAEQREAILSKNLMKDQDLILFITHEVGHDLAEVMFWQDADFHFDSEDDGPEIPAELKLADVIAEAISQSVRLKELKAMIPSEDYFVKLLPLESPDEMVTFDSQQWDMVCAIANNQTVGDVRHHFKRDSFTFYEDIAELIEKNVIALEKPQEGIKPDKGEKAVRVEERAEDTEEVDAELIEQAVKSGNGRKPATPSGKYIVLDED